MPNSFYLDPEISKFDEALIKAISLALRRIEKAELLGQAIDMVHFADLQFSLGEPVVDGFVVLFVSFLNCFPEFSEYIISVCLQKHNYITFLYLITLIGDDTTVKSALLKPLPRTPVRDLVPLSLLFCFVTQRQWPIHFNLLNHFATISSRKEIRIAFKAKSICGLHDIRRKRPPLDLRVVKSGPLSADLSPGPRNRTVLSGAVSRCIETSRIGSMEITPLVSVNIHRLGNLKEFDKSGVCGEIDVFQQIESVQLAGHGDIWLPVIAFIGFVLLVTWIYRGSAFMH
jgi:hypothetical protein